MAFNEVKTLYTLERRKRGFQKLSPQEYYEYKMEILEDQDQRIYPRVEKKWYECLKPYYKINLDMENMLRKTEIKIPTDMLKMPYDCFACILDRDCKPTTDMYDNQEEMEQDIYIDSDFENFITTDFLVCLKDKKLMLTFGHYELYKKKKHPHLGIILRDKEYRKVVIDLSVANDLESCFSRSRYTKTVGGNITVQYFIYKIAIQVALLATNSADKYINPDILKADRGKYYDPKTTNEEKMILTQKAKDKGKNGWELGKGRSLQFANKQSVINLDARDPSKYLRQYQSLRGGHWHKVCHGKKRQQRKIVWFPPTLVRPDLPLPKIKR